ncbi:MAG: DUF1588 domain-containing protein, partial [Gammaproteobacteria bacterium]|nr:DUF1588 domain-containing protein [Gammaproteobacteria bacterium]
MAVRTLYAMMFLVVFALITGCKTTGGSDLSSEESNEDGPQQCKASSSPIVSRSLDDIPLETFFAEQAWPVLEDKCMGCHAAGEAAGNTDFILRDNLESDLAVTSEFAVKTTGLLAKASALVAHGGGRILAPSSDEYKVLEEFVLRLTNPDAVGGDGPAQCGGGSGGSLADSPFFKDVIFGTNEDTLNKAAIIMLGRRPTADELTAVADQTEASLRNTLRQMMQGAEFELFIKTAVNDQILTNKYTGSSAMINEYRGFAPVDYPGYVGPLHFSVAPDYNRALAAEPLELVNYIVTNERDYREVVTADYAVFNAKTAEFFDVSSSGYIVFTDLESGAPIAPPASDDEWLPGRFALGVGTGFNVHNGNDGVIPHPSPVLFPHAGVLTTRPWLKRWENTDTNRNRKRAKMLMKQFWGYDIELTANRPMDADALNDPNNPTFNNPSCTACHFQLDAVAAGFQNWGFSGRFRNNRRFFSTFSYYHREDALSQGYKNDTTADCGKPLGQGGYCDDDLWYADMFPGGILFQGNSEISEMPNDSVGSTGPHDDASLRWLANEFVKDPRFPTGTAKFWYEAIFNEKPMTPPSEGDPNFAAKFSAFSAQQELFDFVAEIFVRDNGHGEYNLKDLLVELFVSPWFRAVGVENAEGREIELQSVGTGALLTPEQLDRKVISSINYAWKLPFD